MNEVPVADRISGHILSLDDGDAFFERIGDTPCCANCRFWRPTDAPGWLSDVARGIPDGKLPIRLVEHRGECRRHAPANLDIVEDRSMGIGYEFPILNFYEWCGDFSAMTDAHLADIGRRERLEHDEEE